MARKYRLVRMGFTSRDGRYFAEPRRGGRLLAEDESPEEILRAAALAFEPSGRDSIELRMTDGAGNILAQGEGELKWWDGIYRSYIYGYGSPGKRLVYAGSDPEDAWAVACDLMTTSESVGVYDADGRRVIPSAEPVGVS